MLRQLSTSSCIFASPIEALAAFGLNYHFKDVCVANSLGRSSVFLQSLGFLTGMEDRHIPPSGAKDMHTYCPFFFFFFYLLPIIKHLDSLNSGSLYYNAVHYGCRCDVILLVSPYGNWGSSNQHKMLKLVCSIALSYKPCFISDPVASSMGLYQHPRNCGKPTC